MKSYIVAVLFLLTFAWQTHEVLSGDVFTAVFNVTGVTFKTSFFGDKFFANSFREPMVTFSVTSPLDYKGHVNRQIVIPEENDVSLMVGLSENIRETTMGDLDGLRASLHPSVKADNYMTLATVECHSGECNWNKVCKRRSTQGTLLSLMLPLNENPGVVCQCAVFKKRINCFRETDRNKGKRRSGFRIYLTKVDLYSDFFYNNKAYHGDGTIVYPKADDWTKTVYGLWSHDTLVKRNRMEDMVAQSQIFKILLPIFYHDNSLFPTVRLSVLKTYATTMSVIAEKKFPLLCENQFYWIGKHSVGSVKYYFKKSIPGTTELLAKIEADWKAFALYCGRSE